MHLLHGVLLMAKRNKAGKERMKSRKCQTGCRICGNDFDGTGRERGRGLDWE
jgi:hypothetical protein